MKIISQKKKSVLQLESHSAMCGSQTQHRHKTQLPFFSWKLCVLRMTQLGWYTKASYGAHHLTFCFLSLNLGWQWQISSTICMKGDDVHESARQAPLSGLSCSWVVMWHRRRMMVVLLRSAEKTTHLSAQRQKQCPSSTNSQMAAGKERTYSMKEMGTGCEIWTILHYCD